jgi:ATP-binding cassette, subfamily F, member 3
VISVNRLTHQYGSRTALSNVTFEVRQGEIFGLLGPNGGGKSTLLKVIAGELTPMAGSVRLGANVRMGYSPQQQDSLDPASTPFETIRGVAAMSDTDVRSFLHFYLFAGDSVFTRVSDLSFGERARLLLARMAASGCNLLLLDEPINHLDIPSRERFEQALSEFEGTVLAVVHDRYFVRRFATRVWLLQDGSVRSYCDLDEMLRVREQKERDGG